MKRPLYVAVLWLVVLALVAGYASFIASMPQLTVVSEFPLEVNDTFTVEITSTVNLEADAFALDPTASLNISLAGKSIFTREGFLTCDEPIIVKEITGFVVGKNILFVRATPSGNTKQLSQALRISVFQGENRIAEQTLWAKAGETFAGEVPVVVVAPNSNSQEHS
jgi:hypothetical protein